MGGVLAPGEGGVRLWRYHPILIIKIICLLHHRRHVGVSSLRLSVYYLVLVANLAHAVHVCNLDHGDGVEFGLFLAQRIDQLSLLVYVGFVTPIGRGFFLLLSGVEAHEVVDDAGLLVVDVALLLHVERSAFSVVFPLVHELGLLSLNSLDLALVCLASTLALLLPLVFLGKVENPGRRGPTRRLLAVQVCCLRVPDDCIKRWHALRKRFILLV